VGVALAALAVLVLRAGAERLHHRLFAALYLLSGVKSVAEGLGPVADSLHAASPLFPPAAAWRIGAAACALLMAPTLVAFVLEFPQPAAWIVRRPALRSLLYAPSLVVGGLLALWLTGALALGARSAFLVQEAFNALTLAATAFAAWTLWRSRRRAPDRLDRRQAGLLLVGFAPSFLATWLQVPLAAWASPTSVRLGGAIALAAPAFELAAGLVVAYAVLRYRLIGLELQVKGGAKYVVMTAVTGTVLFALVLGVENFVLQDQLFSFAGHAGSAVLSGLTGMLLFKPVERLANRLTDRLFPATTKDPAAYHRARAAEVYHAQVAYALRDGQVSEREWAALRNLQAQLGLASSEADRIEADVRASLPAAAPREAATA